MTPKKFLCDLYDGLEDELLINLFAGGDSGVHGETYSLAEIRRGEIDVVQKFVDEQQELKRDVWYCVNPCHRVPVNGKASKDDIDEDVWFVHSDTDLPDDVSDADGWKAMKSTQLKPDDMSSVLIDSGNGLQAVLRLERPVTHDRGEEINRMFCQSPVYRADPAAIDICHVMRMPYTTNFPNEHKRQKGRVECEATLIKMGTSTFKAELFQPATDLDDIPAYIRQIITEGKCDEKEYAGPSEARFAAMIRMNFERVAQDRIRQIIMNQDYFIAPSNKKKMTARWADRELAAAEKSWRDCLVPDYVDDFNEKYFATMREGKFVIGGLVYDDDWQRHRFWFTSKTALAQYYENDKVPVGRRQVNKVDLWMAHPLRRTYKEMVMRPDLPPGDFDRKLNMWRGWSVDAEAGDCSYFEELVNEIICDGDKAVADYFWGWLARGVQHPERQAEVALVLQGGRGTGKGTFASYYGSLFNDHYMTISNQMHLTGNFNDHLFNCLCLFADEAMWAGSHKAASVLKALITERMITIEAKFMPVKNVRNRLKVIMASNERWVVPAGADERRFAVVKLSDKRQKDLDWFSKLHAQMKAGGQAALLHKLVNYDLTNFEIRQPPETAALDAQKDETLDAFEAFWRDELDDGHHGDLSHCFPSITWQLVPKDHLFDRYMSARRNRADRSGPTDKTNFGKRLAEVIPESWHDSQGGVKRGPRMEWTVAKDKSLRGNSYKLPPIADCRQKFSEVMGRAFDWQEATNFYDDPEF